MARTDVERLLRGGWFGGDEEDNARADDDGEEEDAEDGWYDDLVSDATIIGIAEPRDLIGKAFGSVSVDLAAFVVIVGRSKQEAQQSINGIHLVHDPAGLSLDDAAAALEADVRRRVGKGDLAERHGKAIVRVERPFDLDALADLAAEFNAWGHVFVTVDSETAATAEKEGVFLVPTNSGGWHSARTLHDAREQLVRLFGVDPSLLQPGSVAARVLMCARVEPRGPWSFSNARHPDDGRRDLYSSEYRAGEKAGGDGAPKDNPYNWGTWAHSDWNRGWDDGDGFEDDDD